MDLLSGTWSVLEHSLTKWTCVNVSDSEGCIDLSGPVPAMPDISPLDQKCPVLIIARALQRRGWTPVHREVTHARGGPLEFSTSKWSSRHPYLQCLLRLDQLWEMGINSIWSGETASFFCALLLRGKIVAPKQGAAVYRNMLRDVGADDSLPALDMENLPEPAPQPMADADRDADQHSSDEIMEPREDAAGRAATWR